MTNAAIIQINKQSLAELLDFEGGVVHEIRLGTHDYWKPDIIEIVLEHPDLPQVEDGDCMLRIAPAYIIGMRRVDPPKKV
jgi:hypothetical protein